MGRFKYDHIKRLISRDFIVRPIKMKMMKILVINKANYLI